MLIHIMHLPNQTIKTTILDSISSALNSKETFQFTRNKLPKRVIILQSLLDEELLTEMVFASLDNDITLNNMAKVLLNFLQLASELELGKDKYLHVLKLFPIFYHYCSEDSAPHETLKSVVSLIWKMDTPTLLRTMILDLFSKNQKKRINAFKQLNSQNFIKRIFNDDEVRF